MNLYRPEVIEERRHRLHGAVMISHSVTTEVISLLLLGIIILTGAWLATGSYARTETVKGMLATYAPSAKIVPPAPGIVTAILVREGSFVRKGQVLAVIDVDRRTGDGQAIAARSLQTVNERLDLEHAQLRIAGIHDINERDRLEGLIKSDASKLAGLKSEITLQRDVVASNKSLYDLLSTVEDRGFVSRITYEQRRQNLIASQQQLASLEEQSATVEGDLAQARSGLSDLPTSKEHAVDDVRSSIDDLEQQKSQIQGQQSYTVISPIDGKVTAIQVGVGRPARSEIPLMSVVPAAAHLYAALYAPSRAVGFVRPGQDVRLMYDAFPYERFGGFKGRVVSVAATPIDPRELDDPIKTDEPVYRIEVGLGQQALVAYGKSRSLQPGMTLSANLILERRSFLAWLTSPLRAVLRRD